MKHRVLSRLLLSAIAAAGLCVASAATAGTSTTTFQVSVNVISGCAINSIPSLSFGNYVQGGGAATGTTTISLTCSSGTAFVIALNYGLNGSGTQRNMETSPPSGSLPYNLYTDSGYTNIWESTATCGTTGGSSPNCVYGTGTGSAQSFTIYGQIPSGQYPGATGTYTDTVTATVTF